MPQPIAPPPIPYAYDDRTMTLHVASDATRIHAAFEHLLSRSPLTKKTFSIAPGIVPTMGLLLGLALLAIGGAGFVAFEIRAVPLVGVVAMLLRRAPMFAGAFLISGVLVTLLSFVALAKAVKRFSGRISVPVDPQVTKAIPRELLQRAEEVLSTLAPSLVSAPLDVTVELQRFPAEKGENETWQQRDLSLAVRAHTGWGLEVDAAHLSSSTSYRAGNKLHTTTKKYCLTKLSVRAATLPTDLLQRIQTVQPSSFPAVPLAAVGEVALQSGALRMHVRSRYPLSKADLARYVAAMTTILGFREPLLSAPGHATGGR